MHSAKILADSVSPDGVRLTTLQVTFPRIVLAEFNTHRMLSRNSASSRAIPIEKMIRMVEEHPYVPTHWGKNQKGMQAEQEVDQHTAFDAEEIWLQARNAAILKATELLEVGIHKQITNRLLEPFMWHTVICSATEWSNWDHLRANKMAHPEIRLAAELMLDARQKSYPRPVNYGDWHLPLLAGEEAFDEEMKGWACKVSAGRCARVSYLTHDGKRDPDEDVKLADRLLESGHMSPFEHMARPATYEDHEEGLMKWKDCEWLDSETPSSAPREKMFFGNFRGWVQMRKEIPNEQDILCGRA